MAARTKQEKETKSRNLSGLLLKILGGFFAAILILSLAFFHPNDPHLFSQGTVGGAIHNPCGLFGAHLAGFLETLAGVGAWLFPAYLLWEIITKEGRRWYQRLAWLVLAMAIWTLLGAFGLRTWAAVDGLAASQWRWGGWLGSILWPPCRHVLGPVGLPIILALLILLTLLVIAPSLMRALGALLKRWLGDKALPLLLPLPMKGARQAMDLLKRPFLAWKSARVASLPDLDMADVADLQRLSAQSQLEDEQREAFERAQREAAAYRKSQNAFPPEEGLPVIRSVNLDAVSGELPVIHSVNVDALPGEIRVPQAVPSPVPLPPPHLLRDLPPPPPPKPLLVEPKVTRDRFGRVVEQPPLGLTEPTPHRPLPDPFPSPPLKATKAAKREEELSAFAPADRLELPPRRLFDPPGPGARLDLRALEETQALIGQKLSEFKVKGTVVGMQPGPVVTVYEFQLDPGVPLSKIVNMEDDLALGLQAEKVRIDRIPSRNLVGIEVPNPTREIIAFREVVDSPAFRDPAHKDARSLLALALGKDLAGKPMVMDLAKMPHLLIGGSTGSGKSVGVNAMICSVLLRALPSEVKLILVDPKMVELGVYEDIPHLWAPVVTDMKEAGRVLKWVVAQMEDRYRRLALLSVRNLEGFNAKLIEAGGSLDLSDRTPNPRWPERPAFLEPLPYVVVVIDELADLMMVARAEV
ncbi:MAG: DNA translocase FtsK 4TM domain-containing protein, partial [Firmicutes bacterium]|nr:DNA translocase FtsK 4TM domain-containing protein [Bacillota bacterium]